MTTEILGLYTKTILGIPFNNENKAVKSAKQKLAVTIAIHIWEYYIFTINTTIVTDDDGKKLSPE